MNPDEPIALPVPPMAAGGLWILNDVTHELEPGPVDDAPADDAPESPLPE